MLVVISEYQVVNISISLNRSFYCKGSSEVVCACRRIGPSALSSIGRFFLTRKVGTRRSAYLGRQVGRISMSTSVPYSSEMTIRTRGVKYLRYLAVDTYIR